MHHPVSGFSKKSKSEKIEWLARHYLKNPESVATLKSYWHQDISVQQLHDDFSENTVSNYWLPFGLAPNFLINDSLYVLPMVTEESSVVAAAGNAAKFWAGRGGFKVSVSGTTKNGQIHISYPGNPASLKQFFEENKTGIRNAIRTIEKNMKERGGGLLNLELLDKTRVLSGYFQIHATFETLDAMGANFINSCLEQMARTFKEKAESFSVFKNKNTFPEVVMSILSNHVPECLVHAEVSCEVDRLQSGKLSGREFAEKFVKAVTIAEVDTHRAVTHNKGIMNGIDAVVLATGNDFRAVEAGVHAYAARNGTYSGLTRAAITEDIFTFQLKIPLAIGTVGGLTSLHPLSKVSLEILKSPSAKQLMKIMAAAGLAQNFAAVRSLITTGIQKGHMKMHLTNILNQLQASEEEKKKAQIYFKNNPVSHTSVAEFLTDFRSPSNQHIKQ